MESYKGIIYEGDCLDSISYISDNSVDLVVTSPPYFDAINYEDHINKIQDDTEWWERDSGSYGEYVDFLISRFSSVYDVVTPGGYVVVNLSPVISDSTRVPIPFHFVEWMSNLEWDFVKTIIWEKTVAVDRRSGVIIQHPYPGYYYPSIVSEYLLVFQKPAESTAEQAQSHDDSINTDTEAVWKICPVRPSEIDHPSPFPIELADRIITQFSPENGTILDIFGGSGQTYLSAINCNRDWIGCELLPEYVEYSLNRVIEHQSSDDIESTTAV